MNLSQLAQDPHWYRWYPLLACLTLGILLLLIKSVQPRMSKHTHYVIFLSVPILLSGLLLVGAVGFIIVPTPDIYRPILPLFETIYPTQDDPLVIEFDRPISRHIVAEISPHVTGTWKFGAHKYGPFLSDQLVFMPDSGLLSDTEYAIKLERLLPVSWLFLEQAESMLFVFKTPPLPKVNVSRPQDRDRDIDPAVNLTFQLDERPYSNATYSFKATPHFEAEVRVDEVAKQVEIIPRNNLNYATQYQIQLIQTVQKIDYLNSEAKLTERGNSIFDLVFTTVSPVGIQAILPQGDAVLPDQALMITFEQSMEQKLTQQAMVIEPRVEGSYLWANENTLVFTPSEGWNQLTTYTVTINEGARTVNGGAPTASFEHNFTTIGDPVLIRSSLDDTGNFVSTDMPIGLVYNQPLQYQNFSQLIHLEPEEPLEFKHAEERLVIQFNDGLKAGTSYQLTIDAGLQGRYDTVTTAPIQLSFTTKPLEKLLDIPLYLQSYNFTCFSAATQMVLAYYGITGNSELTISNEIGYDLTPRSYSNNTWGDPNRGIVGTYDGSGPGGYGVHWQPVADYISNFRDAEVKRSWNITDMLTEISKGYPVMVWWVNGVWPAKDVSWNTAEGNRVYTVNGMHVEVVRGWQGDINEPERIYTLDPWRGERSYSPAQFLNLWRWFENTAVVIR